MYSKKLYSIIISMIFLSLFHNPSTEAISVFKVAKLGTMAVIGGTAGALAAKGALLGISGPLIAKKLLLAKVVGKVALVGGLAKAPLAKAVGAKSAFKKPLVSKKLPQIIPQRSHVPQSPPPYSPPLMAPPPSYSRTSFAGGY